MSRVETPDAKLVLGGRFSSDEQECKTRKIAGWKKTDFLGWLGRSEAVRQLSEARCGLVVLHPTQAYLLSYPVKMFEYMAAGLPVIASDFPLWREILDGHDCALFVDPCDPDDIAKAIDWMFAHPDEAEQMGRRGMIAVQEIYNWNAEKSKMLSFYEELLS
jgi:glycosyltransferase involved in cell wall biosynthesis